MLIHSTHVTIDMENVLEKLERGGPSSLSDFERQIVLSRLASKGVIDLEALRETLIENESPPPRAREPLSEFRDRLPIEHEVAKLRDPKHVPTERSSHAPPLPSASPESLNSPRSLR